MGPHPPRTPTPPFRTLSQRQRWKTLLHAFRMLCGIGAAVVPTYLVLSEALGLGHRDSMALRLAISGALLVCLGCSFRPWFAYRHLVGMLLGVVYGLMTWLGGLVLFNPGDGPFLLAFLYVYFIGASVFMIAGLRATTSLLFHGYTLAVAAAASLLPAAADRPVSVFFLTCLLGMAGIALLAWQAVTRIRDGLARNERQLDRAQRLARLGSWDYDVATQRLRLSDGLYDLLGLAPTDARPSPQLPYALVHPDDAPRYLGYVEALESGRPPADLDVRASTPRGERWMRLHSHAETDDRGRTTALSGIVMDVTAQREREAELVAAHEQAEEGRLRAEEMSRLKSTLLTNLSHEIRTPLNAIIGCADVLVDEAPAELHVYVEPVRDNGYRLLDTLNGLLELARLQAGDTELQMERVDLVPEVRAAIDHVRTRLQPTHLALSFEAEAPALWGWWDRSVVQSVTAHLVANAVKFTERGTVRVRLTQDDGEAVLAVVDTGRGISADFLPHLFDAFRQESDGLTRSHEGTGIGLAVSRQFVELMGGRIGVRSEVGVGTTFEVRLPRGPGGDGRLRAVAYGEVPTISRT